MHPPADFVVVRKAFRAIRMVRTFRLFKGENDGCGRGGSPKSYEAIGQKGDVSTVCGEDLKFLGSFRISVPTTSELGDRPAAAGESMHLFSAFPWLVHGFTWCLHAPCT